MRSVVDFRLIMVRLVPASADPSPPSAVPSWFDRDGSQKREEAPLARDSDVARASVKGVAGDREGYPSRSQTLARSLSLEQESDGSPRL